MTRIAQFIDSLDPGGAETVVVELTREFRARGIDTTVFHLGNEWITRRCEELGLPHEVVPGLRRYKSSKTLPLFAWQFGRLLRRMKIDLLHSHLLGSVVGGGLTALLARLPHVGTLHDVYMIEERPDYVPLLRLGMKANSSLVAVSNQIRSHLGAVGGKRFAGIPVIANGTDVSRFRPGDKAALRQVLGLDAEQFVFVNVARMVPLKRHDMLIEAFARLPEIRSARLLLVGDGPDSDDLRQLVAARGLAGRVDFMGFRSDAERILAASDCFVLCSDTEGLSCSILEAMASGLPVIATDVGGNPELVEAEKTGYLVGKGDVAGLSAQMAAVQADRAMSRRLGATARSRSEAVYSNEAVADRYLECYRGLSPRLADVATATAVEVYPSGGARAAR